MVFHLPNSTLRLKCVLPFTFHYIGMAISATAKKTLLWFGQFDKLIGNFSNQENSYKNKVASVDWKRSCIITTDENPYFNSILNGIYRWFSVNIYYENYIKF